MSRYLVTLKPIDSYFFGGQTTFGDGGNVNYLVKSETLPQQTTVIGMLRKEILKQAGLFKADNKYTRAELEKNAEKIGPVSFSVENENEFGVLKSVSPVFICSDGKSYIPVPLDYGISIDRKSPGIYGSNALNADRPFIPKLDHYSPKNGLPGGFIDSAGKNVIHEEDIFQPVEKIGIKKAEFEEAMEKAYYKQTCFALRGAFKMAAIVECDLKLRDALVEMGGERSTFQMEVEPADRDFAELFQKIRSGNGGLLLLADSFAQDDIYDKAEFAVTQTVVLRHFIDFRNGIKKSKVYHFIKRGSVFYGDPNEIKKALDKPALRRAGFNIFNSQA